MGGAMPPNHKGVTTMKCKPQRTIAMRNAKIEQEREKQEQAYIDSLSEEEKERYLEDKKKRQEDAWNTFTSLANILDKAGITKYY